MLISLDSYQLQLCSAPPCMGHEEIVLPILVISSHICEGSPPALWQRQHTWFEHFDNPAFHPNNLNGTLAAGLLAGSRRYTDPLNVDDIFAGYGDERWQTVPRINQALEALGERYAFFLERSASPLYDGFIARCRFITPAQLGEFYVGLDVERETAQGVPARQALAAFLQVYAKLPNWEAIYSAHAGSAEFRRLFGDDEAHFVGYAVWPERQGVLRAWTRVVYLPK